MLFGVEPPNPFGSFLLFSFIVVVVAGFPLAAAVVCLLCSHNKCAIVHGLTAVQRANVFEWRTRRKRTRRRVSRHEFPNSPSRSLFPFFDFIMKSSSKKLYAWGGCYRNCCCCCCCCCKNVINNNETAKAGKPCGTAPFKAEIVADLRSFDTSTGCYRIA